VVHGSIDGITNLNFIVDTGAVPSVLDNRLAGRLHLANETGQLSLFTERVDSRRAVVRDVRLGPVHVARLPVVVQDLSLAASVLGTRIDAMVGLDLLGHVPFTIDYQAKEIAFGPINPAFASML
jgi:hypothetical protein